VVQKSFLGIGGTNVVVALLLVGQMSVALTSVAKTSVGEKLRHHTDKAKILQLKINGIVLGLESSRVFSRQVE
jgi:hypothetical protein